MKEYIADEGKVWKNGEEILGKYLYTPDNFDDSNLIQIDKPDRAIVTGNIVENGHIMDNDSNDCLVENNISDVL